MIDLFDQVVSFENISVEKRKRTFVSVLFVDKVFGRIKVLFISVEGVDVIDYENCNLVQVLIS